MEDADFKTELDRFHELKNQSYKLENILALYLWAGVVMALFAAVYFVLVSVDLALDSPRGIALVVASAGVAMTGLSLVTAKVVQLRRSSNYEAAWRSMAVQNLIATWRYFEKVAQMLAEEIKDAKEIPGGSKDLKSPVGYVQVLVANDAMTNRDVYTVRRALGLRNEMVHTSHAIDVASIEKAADDLLDIIGRIETYRPSMTQGKRATKRPVGKDITKDRATS